DAREVSSSKKDAVEVTAPSIDRDVTGHDPTDAPPYPEQRAGILGGDAARRPHTTSPVSSRSEESRLTPSTLRRRLRHGDDPASRRMRGPIPASCQFVASASRYRQNGTTRDTQDAPGCAGCPGMRRMPRGSSQMPTRTNQWFAL